MPSITDRNTSERHEGRDLDAIARRVWGKNARIYRNDDPNSVIGEGTSLAEIVRPSSGSTIEVLASVVLRED